MPLYHYKAVDQSGAIYRGTLHRKDAHDLKTYLQKQGLYLVRVRQKVLSWNFPERRTQISDRLLEELCLHAAALDRAGVTAVEILESLRETSNQKYARAALTRVIEAFRQGIPLSDSFALESRLFDSVFCSMIAAAEKMGALAPTFEQLAQLFKWRHELKQNIWKSLRYPAALTAMVIGLLVLLMTWVIPQLEIFMKSLQQKLPPSTRGLLFISHHALPFFGVLAGLLGSIFLAVSVLGKLSHRAALTFSRSLLSIPLVGEILKKIDLQRFLQIFVSLIERGLSLPDSLKIAAENTHNLFIRESFFKLRAEVLKGVSFSQAWFALISLDSLIGRLATMGENSGQFAPSLHHGIGFLRRDIDYLSQRLISFLEPILILFLGGLILWITTAVFLPLYDQTMALE